MSILLKRRQPITIRLNYYGKIVEFILPYVNASNKQIIDGHEFSAVRFKDEVQILSLLATTCIRLAYNKSDDVITCSVMDYVERNYYNA